MRYFMLPKRSDVVEDICLVQNFSQMSVPEIPRPKVPECIFLPLHIYTFKLHWLQQITVETDRNANRTVKNWAQERANNER